MDSLLSSIPPIPRALVEVVMQKSKRVQRQQNRKAMELCLTIFLQAHQHTLSSGYQGSDCII